MRGNRRNVRNMRGFSGSNVRRSGMSRRRFMGTVAAGVGAAAIGLGGVAKAGPPPGAKVVYPTGIDPTDVDEVQAAVDGTVGPSGTDYGTPGGTVYLSPYLEGNMTLQHFQFGTNTYVEIHNDVEILGGTDPGNNGELIELPDGTSYYQFPNGMPLTEIRGGYGTFRTYDEVTATISGIHFHQPILTAIAVAAAENVIISGNMITDPQPFDTIKGFNFAWGMSISEWNYGLFPDQGLPGSIPPALSEAAKYNQELGLYPSAELSVKNVTVENNKITLSTSSGSVNSTMGVAVWDILEEPDKVKTYSIKRNKVTYTNKFTGYAIWLAACVGASATVQYNAIENSHVGLGCYSHFFYGDRAGSGHILSVNNISCRHRGLYLNYVSDSDSSGNQITCYNSGAPFNAAQMAFYVLNSTDNTVNGNIATGAGYWGGIVYRGSGNEVSGNNLSGMFVAYNQLVLQNTADNLIQGNSFGGVYPPVSDGVVWVYGADDNQIELNDYSNTGAGGWQVDMSGKVIMVGCVLLEEGTSGNRVEEPMIGTSFPYDSTLCTQVADLTVINANPNYVGDNEIVGLDDCNLGIYFQLMQKIRQSQDFQARRIILGSGEPPYGEELADIAQQ